MSSSGEGDLDEILRTLQAFPESEDGWNRLFRVVWPYLLAAALRSLGSSYRASAPDIAQEVFLQLARAPLFDRFQDGKRLRNYLATVTRSRAYDFLRREGRITPTAALDELSELAVETEAADAYESSALLRGIRASLSAADRDLLDRMLLGYSRPELAEQLGISEVAARVRVHRLRLRVQAYIDDHQT